MAVFDDTLVKRIVVGRIKPYVYSFMTNTLPNYLKVGDTYRPVEERLNEWRRYYSDLSEISRHEAVVRDEVFFRDYSVHQYLASHGVERAQYDIDSSVFSNEFFIEATKQHVDDAIEDIRNSYQNEGIYDYYDKFKDLVVFRHERSQNFRPRANQQDVINNFCSAVQNGRSNLLMYAVMRFGKSVTSLWCAKNINAKLIVVVSAKADVKSEWKQAVESHVDFTGYRFVDHTDLRRDKDLANYYDQPFTMGNGTEETCTNIVLFFTLQDLAGSTSTIKSYHEILSTHAVDLLVIDETHFGARAHVLGKILAGVELTEEDRREGQSKAEAADKIGDINKLTKIDARVKLHLSGTPYRILMGGEFEKDDIIAFIQFSDI